MELYNDTLLPALAEGAAQADRRVDEIDRMIEIKLSYDPNIVAALENTRFWGSAVPYSGAETQHRRYPVEMEVAADALPIEQVARRWIVGSDCDALVAEIRPYVDAGFNHLVFHAPGHDQRRFLQLFESDLAGRIRALVP
ncbi:MAG TPA: LLM class flavin-dependent oxidoreductase [Mycobacterium sp.]